MESLLDEITRVTEIRTEYLNPELKGAGNIAAHFMEQDINSAKKCINSGDVIEMIRIHEKLKEWER